MNPDNITDDAQAPQTEPVQAPETPQAPAPEPAAPEAPKKDDSLFAWLRENIEAVIIAFIMALVIKCFCIEVFKIPTGSMEPTLHGNPQTGDRIMVNKFFYNYDEIERYNVIIFKYPLDNTKTFIKRVVGLPNEKILLYDGDLYANPDGDDSEEYFVARKPFDVQQEIWIPVYPSEDMRGEGNPFTAGKTDEIGKDWSLPDSLKTDPGVPGRGSSVSGQTPSAFSFKKRIFDSLSDPLISGNPVPDCKMSFDCSMSSAKGAFYACLGDENNLFMVTFDAEQSGKMEYFRQRASSVNGAPEKTVLLDWRPAPGTKTTIELMKFDGTFYAVADGTVICRFPYRDALTEADPKVRGGQNSRIEFGSVSGDFTFADVALWRDLYYISEGVLGYDNQRKPRVVEIPADSFFMLGDNSFSSKDSRRWDECVIRLKNGQALIGDTQRDASDGDGKTDNPIIRNKDIRFRDSNGFDHVIDKSLIKDFDPYNLEHNPHPLVKKEEIVGKAFIVWWPPKRFKVIK